MTVERTLKKEMQAERIKVSKSEGDYQIALYTKKGYKTYNLYSKDFQLALKLFFLENHGERLQIKEVLEAINYLELECFKCENVDTLYHRVYLENKSTYLYDLGNNQCVWIQDGECSIEQCPDFLFKHSNNFEPQVSPDFNVDPLDLLYYVEKHFNVMDEDSLILLTLNIVASMCSLEFNHALVMFQGEKGSGKSQALRKFGMIIDPQKSGICSFPSKKDGLVLRLRNSYLVTWDNASFISQQNSDLLCMAITGASDTDRQLYSSTEERIVNLHSIIAMSCINMVARSSDLIDRICLIKLERLQSEDLKTEDELMDSFIEDLPKILGAIFLIINEVLSDTSKVKIKKKIRLADFHEWCVRIGKVLDIDESEITRILFQNRMEMSVDVLEANTASICLIELMKDIEEYVDTPTACLNDLKGVANKLGIDSTTLPRDASRLTRILIPIISELKTVHEIEFSIERGKTRRYHIINRKLFKDEED